MPYFIFAFRGILGMWRSCWDSSSWLYRNTNLSSLLGWVPFFSSLWPSVCLDLSDFFFAVFNFSEVIMIVWIDVYGDIFFYFYVWMPERLDPDTSGIRTTLCDHSFQCPCVSKWTYLSCQVCSFPIPSKPVLTFYYTLIFGWYRQFYCPNMLVWP